MSKRKGIILAGGQGTRLFPLTHGVSKQLLPIYSKPLIYYPISTLMFAGIRDILLITTPEDLPNFQRAIGDGSQWGVNISYASQNSPNGIACAYQIGRRFVGNSHSVLALGDNIFHGYNLVHLLNKACEQTEGASVFSYKVKDASQYGVVEFDENFTAISIEEKPLHPRSNYALTGLYFYDNNIIDIVDTLKPSPRGELEITDVNKNYLQQGRLNVIPLGRGFSWFDTGTHGSMLDASNFIHSIEARQGLLVCCPEEIAWRQQWISDESLLQAAQRLSKVDYGQYLLSLLKGE